MGILCVFLERRKTSRHDIKKKKMGPVADFRGGQDHRRPGGHVEKPSGGESGFESPIGDVFGCEELC